MALFQTPNEIQLESRVAELEQQLIMKEVEVGRLKAENLKLNEALFAQDKGAQENVNALSESKAEIVRLTDRMDKAATELTRLQNRIIDLTCPNCPYECKGNVACSKLGLSKPMQPVRNCGYPCNNDYGADACCWCPRDPLKKTKEDN